MKLTKVALFAAGYVIGSRAGHERYAQIVDGVARASQRLEEFSFSPPPGPTQSRPRSCWRRHLITGRPQPGER